MKSNNGAKLKFAKMNILDVHLSYISKKMNFIREWGQF